MAAESKEVQSLRDDLRKVQNLAAQRQQELMELSMEKVAAER